MKKEPCLQNNQPQSFTSPHEFLVENELHLDECKKANVSASAQRLCAVSMEVILPTARDSYCIHDPFHGTIFSSGRK
jgi:hypothetical protein